MGKIVMSGPQNVSLDGVVQDPDGQEGFRLGGWFVQFGGKDLEQWNKVALDEALRAEAWLLGRRSYEFFGVRWRPRSGELADRLNSMPKYVVSSTLEDPEWNNTTVLKGDLVAEVSKLKQELDRSSPWWASRFRLAPGVFGGFVVVLVVSTDRPRRARGRRGRALGLAARSAG
jgi:hypothetical protein